MSTAYTLCHGIKKQGGVTSLDNVEGDFMEEEAYEMDFNKKKVLE